MDIKALLSRAFIPYDAFVVSGEAPLAVRVAARVLKLVYGARIQICDTANDEVEFLAMFNATDRDSKRFGAVGRYFYLSNTLTIPPLHNCLVDFEGTLINKGGAAGQDAIVHDSIMNCDIRYTLIVSPNNGAFAALRIKPANADPIDGILAGVASQIKVSSIAKNANLGTGYGLVLDGTNCSIDNDHIFINEVVDFAVAGLTLSVGGNNVSGNDILIMFIHTCGIAWQDHARFYDNNVRIFDFGEVAGTGLDIFGDENTYDYHLNINNIRTANRAAVIEAGAADNRIYLNSRARARGITDTAASVTNKILPYTEGARVFRNANQAMPSGASTAVTFTSAIFDSDPGVMWAGGAPTRITIRTSGRYLVSAQARWVGDAAGTYREIYIDKNAGDMMADSQLPPNASAEGQWHVLNAICNLVSGDWLELKCGHDAGHNVDIMSEAGGSTVGRSPVLMAQRIG